MQPIEGLPRGTKAAQNTGTHELKKIWDRSETRAAIMKNHHYTTCSVHGSNYNAVLIASEAWIYQQNIGINQYSPC